MSFYDEDEVVDDNDNTDDSTHSDDNEFIISDISDDRGDESNEQTPSSQDHGRD